MAVFPKQIKYIVGNEACERFSFYGMRTILIVFMTKYLLLEENHSEGVFHLFVGTNYFLPMFGAYLSDRYWGKYKTIMYLSLVYCLGHLALALFESEHGLYFGLALIAMGAGGIKPCVTTHVGDQFDKSNSHLLEKIYEVFYWSVNVGSIFSSLLTPWVLKHYGPRWAFGIPGILMGIATYIFWLGRHYYVTVPPTGKAGSMRFWEILMTRISGGYASAKAKFRADQLEGAQAALSVMKVFVFVIGFFALYDQHSSTWVLQAEKMDRNIFGWTIEASQIQSLNPILVLILIPLLSLVIFPAIEKRGIKVTPLRKMGAGMFITVSSFLLIWGLQLALDAGQVVSAWWHLPAFILLTTGEVLISIPGLEFAYTQAPRAMKSTLMSLWFLTFAAGNYVTAFISFLNPFTGAGQFLFYSVLMFVVSVAFVLVAKRYPVKNYIEEAVPA